MADKNYLVGGIGTGTNFEIGAKAPIDSRFTVLNAQGLDELLTYEGLISYNGADKTYYQFVDGAWKPLSVKSAAELEEIIKGLIATETTGAMEFKGAAAALPENPGKGDMYKVAGDNISIIVDGVTAKVGDTIIYNGEKWTLIPSGDDIEDTWRKVIAGGNELGNDETLELVAGENVAITEDGGKVTISSTYENTHYESKLVVGNESADASDENVVENGNVHINLVEDGTVKSSHKIVGAGGITVTHATGEDGNVITIEAPEGAKYDLAAKTENNEAVLSLAGTDNTEDKVAIVGDDAVTVTVANGKIKISAHDTKYTGSEGEEIKVVATDDGAITAELTDAVRGLISDNAEAIENLGKYVGEIPTNYTEANVIAYINKKAEETLAAAQGGSSETAASVKQQLDNYKSENDTRVKNVEDALTDKVDKAEGYSLVADTEIARLANVKNYDDTALAGKITNLENNSATKAELQNVDKKFANYVTSEIYNEAVTGFAEAIENVYTKDEADGKFITAVAGIPGPGANPMAMYVCPTKMCRMWAKTGDAINSRALYILQVDTLPEVGIAPDLLSTFEYAYQLTTDATKVYFYENEFYSVPLDELNFVSYTELINNPGSEVTRVQTMSDFEPTLHTFNGENWMPIGNDGAGVEADNFLRFAERADVYVKGEVDTAVQGAKDYAKGLVDAIPAQTDYTVTIDEDTTDSTIAKRYIFKQLGQEIGRIDLAKELVVTSGTVKEVTVTDMPYVGAKVGDKYIELVIANQTAPIYIPAKDLVDIYTAAAGAAEVQVAINNTNEISATLVNGGITEAKLHADVAAKLNKTWEEVGVAKGLVDTLADGQVKTNTGAIAAINNTSTGILAQAKGYADTKKNEAIAAAKTETENQVKALAGEGNTSTVKKNADDIATLMGLLTWGTF